MSEEYYKFIWDEGETYRFWTHLSPLLPTESYYFTLAARKKKLSQEESEKFQIKSSDMFFPLVMKSSGNDEWRFDEFMKHVYRVHVDKRAFLTKAHLPYPEKALVLYFDPNPCNEIACIHALMGYISSIQEELINASVKMNMEEISLQLKKLSHAESKYKTSHSQNPSRRIWVDFDFDYAHDDISMEVRERAEGEILSSLEKFLPKEEFLLVRTAGGVHALIKKDVIKFPPSIICSIMDNGPSRALFKEIMKNDSGFIPLPGSIHYTSHGEGIIVKVLNGEGGNA